VSIFDTVMSDTVGVVYRAATGKPDQWTIAEIADEAAKAQMQASGGKIDYDTAYAAALVQAQSVADQSSATTSWWDIAKQTYFNDNGTGCGISNMGGCYPSWFPYVVVGGVFILLLWVLRPYVELADGK
jgi:hypothetical protein